MNHWTLNQLLDHASTVTKKEGDKWPPCQPENTKRGYLMWHERFLRAWDVFTCRADTFVWPETKESK